MMTQVSLQENLLNCEHLIDEGEECAATISSMLCRSLNRGGVPGFRFKNKLYYYWISSRVNDH